MDGPTSDEDLRRAWTEVAERAAGCQSCPLWRDATVTVFGEGPVPAPVMLVGEQPGDQEDRSGRPFVGPAGRVLDDGLADAGFERAAVYITNAVKHFKFTQRGKRRIHQKPTRSEVLACRPWLDEEIRLVRPELLILMGATAAQDVFGTKFRLTAERGLPLESELAPSVVATVHPSSILRGDPADRRAAMAGFVADLAAARALL